MYNFKIKIGHLPLEVDEMEMMIPRIRFILIIKPFPID